jgi:protocatechuate 3,4-dioxygenase beta subunit
MVAVSVAAATANAAPARPAAGAEENVTLTGKAVSTAGRPVPGVKVTYSYTNFGESSKTHTWTATSDAKGEFQVEVPAEAARMIQVHAEGPAAGSLAPIEVYQRGGLNAMGDPDALPVITVLMAPATARIAGVICGDGNQPVPGATVTLSGGERRGIVRKAVADAAGKYEIAALSPGNYTVTAVTPPPGTNCVPLSTWKPYGVRRVPLSEGAKRQEDFKFPRGGRIVGRVLDEAGKPLAGAAVSCGLDAATEEGPPSMYQMSGQWYSGSAVTDATGAYSLGGLTRETYVVSVHPPEGGDLAPATMRGVTVPVGTDVKAQDVQLAKGGKLTVVVQGPAAKPLAGATVSINGNPKSLVVVADAQGHAVFTGVPTGKYDLAVVPPGAAPNNRKTIRNVAVVAGLAMETTADLGAGASLGGKVTDADGKPLAGATVRVNHGYTGSFGPAATDADGKFADAGVGGGAADKWTLSVAPPQGAPLLMGVGVELKDPTAGAASDPIDVRLDKGAAVVGVVKGPDGKPVAGAKVLLSQGTRGGASTFAQARTGPDGRYVLAQAKPGQYQVVVGPPDGANLLAAEVGTKPLAAGEQATVDVSLPAGTAVVGQVKLASATHPAPPCHLRLAVKREGGGLTWLTNNNNGPSTYTGPGGTFRFDGVPPGSHQLTCEPLDPQYRGEPVEVTVSAAGEQRAEVRILLAGSVTGVVHDAKGKPVGGDMVFLSFSDATHPNSMASLNPDEKGHVEAIGLLPGTYTLTARLTKKALDAGLAAPAPAEVKVLEGKQSKIDVKVESK